MFQHKDGFVGLEQLFVNPKSQIFGDPRHMIAAVIQDEPAQTF